MTLPKDLAGRTAFVTGGARGLGRAIADRLRVAGARVVTADLAEALGEKAAEPDNHALDIGADGAQAALGAIADTLGPVDIVVANAGVVPPWRGMVELDRAEWQRVMNINVWGVAATIGAFSGALAASGRGSAIVMASINGFKAHPKQVAYTASKHAAIGVMRAAALDLGPQGIRVNAIAPGPIATEALVSRIETRAAAGGPDRTTALDALAQETALGRIATPEDVANVAHFLASDASAGITGSVLPVEAGLV